MTRKHYIAIAKIINSQVIGSQGEARDALRSVAIEFACVAKNDNPNFDRDRFYAACGF